MLARARRRLSATTVRSRITSRCTAAKSAMTASSVSMPRSWTARRSAVVPSSRAVSSAKMRSFRPIRSSRRTRETGRGARLPSRVIQCALLRHCPALCAGRRPHGRSHHDGASCALDGSRGVLIGAAYAPTRPWAEAAGPRRTMAGPSCKVASAQCRQPVASRARRREA